MVKSTKIPRLLVILVLGCGLLLPLVARAAPFTIAALQSELVTDPASIGYNVSPSFCRTVGDDTCLLTAINAPRAGPPFRVLQTVTRLQLYKAIASTELPNFTAAQTQQLLIALTLPELDLSDTDVQDKLKVIFPATTNANATAAPLSRANVIALAQRPGSRAEALWGAGFTVTLNQISCALRGTGC